ncbi:hypothetical protein FOMPIDRAFT_1056653, partial [Fomitopsis schrenkii]
RVAIICIQVAIVRFAQPVHALQGFGIALTFGGLYMYNQAKSDVEQGERTVRRVAAARNLELSALNQSGAPNGQYLIASTQAAADFTVAQGGMAAGRHRGIALRLTFINRHVPNAKASVGMEITLRTRLISTLLFDTEDGRVTPLRLHLRGLR